MERLGGAQVGMLLTILNCDFSDNYFFNQVLGYQRGSLPSRKLAQRSMNVVVPPQEGNVTRKKSSSKLCVKSFPCEEDRGNKYIITQKLPLINS